VSAVFLVRRYGFPFIKPLLWRGIAYSIGGVADFLRWPTVVPRVVESHEVFHVAVLVGAVFHWLFIRQFAGGRGDQGLRLRLPTGLSSRISVLP
jgi:predicted membrane channel-forming protein YqfA (hemolysin III family)